MALRFRCPKCGAFLPDIQSLYRHLEKSHGTDADSSHPNASDAGSGEPTETGQNSARLPKVALGLAIAGFLLEAFQAISYPLLLAAIVLGIISRNKIRKGGNTRGLRYATSAIVIGAVALILSLALSGWVAWQRVRLEEQIKELDGSGGLGVFADDETTQRKGRGVNRQADFFRNGHKREGAGPTANVPSWARVNEFQIREARKVGVRVAKEVDLGGSETTRLVYIPPGAFTMGSASSGEVWIQHRVTLAKGFYMGITEVTQGQWRAVMGNEPWQGQDYARSSGENAANYISWDDASTFCQALSRKAGVKARLPSEAEWEYACRAGTTTAYSFGDSQSDLGNYAWYGGNVSGTYAHPVGRKKPNAWGLYDMHGNVNEWCEDWYGDYPSGMVMDPPGPASGKYRVLRGGFSPVGCRSWYRYWDSPGPLGACGGNGFRVVVSPLGLE